MPAAAQAPQFFRIGTGGAGGTYYPIGGMIANAISCPPGAPCREAGGTAGVPHGYTSCVMLPHVLRFNKPVNAARQALVAEALGLPGGEAADAVAALIADLGLPRTLRDVGVRADQLDVIAEGSMHDRMVHTNPRRIEGPAVVRQLLDAAW
jgi:maleylacetate reductase